VFILNAFFPPLVWLIDPYGIVQVFRRQREHHKGNLSVVTQQEANNLMEDADYF
jgi:Uma2 family endonuclease